MILSLAEGKDLLRIDQANTDNDAVITSLIEAIPDYIEMQTGLKAADQATNKQAKVAAGFILNLWYFSESADDQKLTRVINSLLKCITLQRGNQASGETT